MSNYQNIIDVIKDREDKGKNGGVRNAISRIESSGMSYDNQFNHFEDRQIAAPVFNSKYVTQYDDPTDPELYDKVAHRQPWINKASAGVARVATKAGSEIAKIPGIAAGILSGTVGQIGDVISGRDDTDFMKVAFDNAWVNALNDANEWVNEEVLPVYVKKSVSEGNLWDNVSSIDFWATDGADGLGYIAAMLAPGAVLSRLKLGKLLVGDIGKLTNMAEKGVSRAGRLAKMGLPTNAKNIDLYLETIANTVLESGLEAQQAMQEFEEGLNEQLKNGLITQEQFDQEIQKRSKIGRNIFGANAAILIGPNAVMSKMLWGGARNSARGIDKTTGRIAKEEAKSVLGRINEAGQTFAKGALREGFWEEGMQETAGNYFGDNPDASFGDYLKGLPASYLDMIGTVDGQKAIFLGAAFGGGMNVFMGSKQSKKERNKKNELIDYTNDRLENLWTSFGEKAYERDENGEPLRDENGRIQFNIPVLQEKLTSMNAMDNLSASYDIAVANGQVEKVAQIRDKAVVAMIMPFLQNEALGVEVLREYLSTAPGLEQLAKDEKVSKESLIESIMDKAKFMQQAMENFNDFSEPLLDINHKEATAEDIDAYYEGLRDVYNNLQANRQFVNKRLEKFTGVLEKVVQERGHNLIKFTDDIDYKNSIKESDMRIKDLSEKVDSYRKADKEISDLENDFWNREKNQKNFDRLFDKLQEVEQAESEEVDSNEIGDTLDSIDKATSNIGVDNIINKYKVGKNKGDLNPMVLEKANEKKEQLKIIEEEAKKKKLEEQKRRSEKSKKSNKEKEEKKDDLGNRIGNNYNPGESIPLTRAELEPYSKEVKKKDKAINEFTGVIAKAEDNTPTSVTVFILETRESITIPKNNNKLTPVDLEQNFSTEGSENHDILTPKDGETNESMTASTSKTGTKLISTNENGEPLSWVLEQYPGIIKYEKNPSNKKGDSVNFEINTNNDVLTKNQQNAVKLYNKLLTGETLNQKEQESLIDNLPLNAIVSEGVKAPIESLPKTKASKKIFEKSTKKLRIGIVNRLIAGEKLENITTTIEGQYGGILKVESLDENNKIRENNVLDLYHFGKMSKKEKIDYIKRNIAMVDQIGNLVYLNGKKEPFFNKKGESKANAKGEIYLMIPKANGLRFPLKLNIKKLESNPTHVELLARLYEISIEDAKTNKNTTVNEISDEQFKNDLKAQFKDEQKLIKKPWSDMTVNDIISLLIFDNSKSIKSRIGFLNPNNPNEFSYGDPTKGGQVIQSIEELNVDNFRKWLSETKRYNIRFKKQKTDTMNAIMDQNDAYIEYLLDSKILNTNAVVGDNPTFQGYTNIYLKSDISTPNSTVKQPSQTTNTTSEIEQKIEEIKKNKDFIKLSEDGSEYVNTKTGKKYRRVTEYISNKKVTENELLKSASAIGNKVDSVVRDFFNDTLKSAEQYNLTSEKNFNTFVEGLKKIKKTMDSRGEIVLADDIVLYNDEIGVAGTVDLLTYDKDGTIRIYDMKTMRGNNFDSAYKGDKVNKYESTRYGKSKKEAHTDQLSLYRILLNNTHGLKAKTIAVMAIEVSYKSGSETTTKLNIIGGVTLTPKDQIKKARLEGSTETVLPKEVETLSEALTIEELPESEQNKYRAEIRAITEAKLSELLSQGISILEAPQMADEQTQSQQQAVKNKYLKVENTDDNISNSGNNFVSSHEIPNTPQKKASDSMKKQSQKTDVINATKEDIKNLKTELMKYGLWVVGSEVRNNIMSKKTNQEIYNQMVIELNKYKESIDNTEKNCKNGM